MYGICILALIPLRAEPKDQSELISQVFFGEIFEVLEVKKQWTKICLQADGYEGWIDSKQFQEISFNDYEIVTTKPALYNYDLVGLINGNDSLFLPIPLGASLSFLELKSVNVHEFCFDGLTISGQKSKSDLISTAKLYLHAPYLWGGKSAFGIDCSGFTQMVYKLNGHFLPRDASQQATLGEVLSFIEESEPGDLAFFDNEEGKIIHVGIILHDNYIIHVSGQVRIDRIDHLGIYNETTQTHSHRLRVIKKII